MTSPARPGRRLVLFRLVGALLVFLALAAAVLVWSWQGSRARTPASIYLPSARAGLLAIVEAAPDRVDQAGCVVVLPPDDGEAPGVRTCPEGTFDLGGLRYRLHSGRSDERSIELVGALLASGSVGSARGADRQIRLPGVAAEHLDVLPPSACPEPGPCVRSRVGGGRTLFQPVGSGAARPLPPGRLQPVADGDVVWLGISPLAVRLESTGVALELPPDYQAFGGERGWIHDPAPRWSLSGSGPWDLWSERSLYLPGHLASRRIDRQLEEEIQRLIDFEVLCLEPGVPRTERPPRVVWSEGFGCGEGQVQPIPRQVVALRTRYRHHPALQAMVDEANRHLAQGSYVARPEVLGFTFDWAYMVAPWAEGFSSVAGEADGERTWTDVDSTDLLVPVPTRLLGFWWGRTEHGVPAAPVRGRRARKEARASDGAPTFDVRVREGTTSPQLRVENPAGEPSLGALRHDDLLLLVGSPEPVDVDVDGTPATLLASLCEGTVGDSSLPGVWRRPPEEGTHPRLYAGSGAADSRDIFAPAFPVGRMTISAAKPDRLLLEPLSPPGGDSCLHVARTGGGDWAWSRLAASAPDPAAKRAWHRLEPGTSVPWGAASLVLRDNGDLAATSAFDERARDWRRIYPFEEDLGQLLGRGSRHYSGIEASITPDLALRVKDDLELTIHGDLQRIVSRALATAMQVNLDGRSSARRDVKDPGSRRGSAVLMDADSGQILAAATWPPFDPNQEASEEDAWRAELRARGTSFDPAENWAFVRNRAAGSTYKLATSLALARAGLLRGAESPAPGTACSGGRRKDGPEGGLRVYSWSGDRVVPRTAPARDGAVPGSHHRCEANHRVIPVTLDEPASTFVAAFAESCNVWFSLATYRLMDHAVPMGAPADRRLDMGKPDLGVDEEGPLLFRVDGRLGVLWPKRRPLAQVIAPRGPGGVARNLHADMLLELGHRFLYPVAGGLVTQQTATEWAPGQPYPSASPSRQWLPGLEPGLGFRYPELPGPAAYGGASAWPDGSPPGPDFEGGRLSSVGISRSLRGAAVTGWGQEVGASALSLAAIASVPASAEGRAPVPRVVLDPDPLLPDQRAVALASPPPVLAQASDLLAIRTAMREVVGDATGTARTIFARVLGLQQQPIVSRVGGKTGTISVSVPVGGDREDLRDSLRRVRFFACGVLLPDEVLGASPEQRYGDALFASDWGWFLDRMDAPPTFGFASAAPMCRPLVPGAPSELGRDLAGQGGQGPVEQFEDLYARRADSTRLDTVTSSAFVAAVFDGFVPGPASLPEGVPPSLATGRGLALAVIADNHPTAAKEAAAAILSDILVYYQARGDALPIPR